MAVFDPPVSYPALHRCIYCLTGAGAGDEHIIPFALNGTQVLPKASCEDCGKVTSYLDGFACRSVFWQLRVSAGLRTRNAAGVPTEFPIILTFADGHEERELVPAGLHPSLVVLPKFEEPDLLSGRVPDGMFRFSYRQWMRESDVFDEYKRRRGAIDAAGSGCDSGPARINPRFPDTATDKITAACSWSRAAYSAGKISIEATKQKPARESGLFKMIGCGGSPSIEPSPLLGSSLKARVGPDLLLFPTEVPDVRSSMGRRPA